MFTPQDFSKFALMQQQDRVCESVGIHDNVSTLSHMAATKRARLLALAAMACPILAAEEGVP